jgi:hypothetical protein
MKHGGGLLVRVSKIDPPVKSHFRFDRIIL